VCVCVLIDRLVLFGLGSMLHNFAAEREIQLHDLGENAVEIELSCLKWRVVESWNPYIVCKVVDTEESKAVFEIQTPSVPLDKGVASYVCPFV
jgi:hypothetical protein